MGNDPEAGEVVAGGELEAPLLQPATSGTTADFRHSECTQALKSNFWDCTTNLTKVILGAGIMALPRAVALLGWGLGLSLLVVVGLLTHFTVHGLILASDRCRRDTYSSLVRTSLGPIPEKVLQGTLLLGCLGFEVVYIDIIGDLLLGDAPDYDGLITTWLPQEDKQAWWVGRQLVLAALTAGVLAPLASMRTMGGLGLVNLIGLGSLAGFAGATIWLAVAAIVSGRAYALPLGPDLPALGSTTAQQITGALSVVPILLTAASCHQSVHPLRAMLVPYSRPLLDKVVATSLTMVTALFVVVCLSAYTAFGPNVRGNFLNNLSPAELTPLIGATAGNVVSLAIKAGYAVSLVGSAVLIMFPLRQSLLELVAPAAVLPGAPPVSTRLYLSCTYGLLATVYGIAVYVPSIWDVISFVGSVACTIMCFIIPAALLVMYVDQPTLADRLQRACAWGVGLLGLGLFLNVFVGLYLSLTQPPAAKPSPPPGLGAAAVEGLEGAGVLATAVHAWLWRAAGRAARAGADGCLKEVLRWAGWGA
ncbi:hypothetical protein HYH02_009953 [Chlamydomonas schloesseri]|uniref:Amino acid transporter transmembrane domain-containing protein n=1 Tax=Chlamydomonas schloesseri TaxID=2026947 RepID=A0A835TCW9_9CHLO|nr:hypothetical protein HYH02_009953 [Chlamydomonas schloesseri]|eukprot:KAG2441362.1 hypothetical protein HYH02_009953 [Chlamydomonas schloesseri]